MVDKNYCASSFLMYRRIVDKNKSGGYKICRKYGALFSND